MIICICLIVVKVGYLKLKLIKVIIRFKRKIFKIWDVVLYLLLKNNIIMVLE